MTEYPAFQIFNPVKVIYGVGKINVLESMAYNKPLFICDPVVEKLGVIEKIEKAFSNFFVFSEVEPNPSCELINKIVGLYKHENIDCVIGIGGGSSLDTAKAVSSLLKSGGNITDYLLGPDKFSSRTNLVLIPTTAGTGSEVTNVGVYTYQGLKKPMTSDTFWADVSIVDPELTYSMPVRVTASTGLDALTHALESYWAKSSQPYTEGLALVALKIILENLKSSINGEKIARNNMALAATIAGIAFSQTRTTAAHAISFPLTSFYGIEHGVAVALTLPKLIHWTYPYIKSKMDALLRYLQLNSIETFSETIEKLMIVAGTSTRLRDYGVKQEDIEKIAKVSMEANIIKLTPGDITYEDVIIILEEIY
ncbi:MAG: iron-containing alcohol dehydrogenase [Fervidobacterium sp.]